MIRSTVLGVAAVSAVLVNGVALAHSNFVENYDGSREWMEGQRVFFKLNLAHTCGHGGVSQDIRDIKLVFPNGKDAVVNEWLDPRGTAQAPVANGLKDILWTYNTFAPTDPSAYRGANAVMSIKPSVDNQWKSIEPTKEEVPVYYNHGDNTWDVASIHYTGLTGALSKGKWGLTNEYYKNVEFVATLGYFKKDSCYSKVVVDIPAADYCADGHAYVWWKSATPSIPNELLASAGYAPVVTIKRNLAKNPLPESCGGIGKTAEVAPSNATLDRYFADVATWVSKKKGGKSMKGLVDNRGCVAPETWNAEMGHCMKQDGNHAGH